MTEQQQVAMIQTLLHLIGAKDYKPSGSTVLALLREFSHATAGGWSSVKNQTNPNKGTSSSNTGGWSEVSNNNATSTGSTTSTSKGWDVAKNQSSAATKPQSRQR